MPVRSYPDLEAFHFRSARLQALLMLRTQSFIQGGGLVATEQGLDNLKGATMSSAAVQRFKNPSVSSSAEQEEPSRSRCRET